MKGLYPTLTACLLLATTTGAYAQPANDDCANAQLLTVNDTGTCPGAAITVSTADATLDGNDPICDDGTVQDVWFTFSTAGFSSPFTLQLAGVDAEHWAAELYAGSCTGALFACYPEAPELVVFNNLDADATYVLRLFTNTDLGAAGELTVCLSAAPIISWCGATIYDEGGPTGNYPGALLPYNSTFVYCPDDPNDALSITFTQFNTRTDDILRIYDGPNNTFPLLGAFSGNLTNNLPGSFTSTHPSGCLTFRFSYGGFFFTAPGWAATSTCCSTPIVMVEPTSNGPICLGGELQLFANTNFGTDFLWTGPGGFTSTEENPVIPDFTQANIGNYSLSANAGVPGCNANTASVSVGSIQPPPVVNAVASEVELCIGAEIDLFADVPLQIAAVQEGFETWPATGWGTTGTGITTAQNNIYYMEGSHSMRFSHGNDGVGSYSMTSSIDLTSLPNPELRFWHICALEQGYDYGFVEYSVNGGANWAQLPASSYLGTGNSNFNPNARFSRNSYAAWQSQFTGSTSTPGTGPGTDLWREEAFDLSAFATSANFRIRFRIAADFTINYYGWLIDDIRIFGDMQDLEVEWSSDPVGFSSTAFEILGVPVSETTTFTVTAYSAPGCANQGSVTVALIGPQVTIEGAPGFTVCAGEPFDLVGSATGGEEPLVFVWYGGDLLLGTSPTLEDVVLEENTTVTLTVFDGSSCDNQQTLEVEVLPLPNVTLANLAPVCLDWAPFALTGGTPAGGQYLVDGVAATTFDPAVGTGSYEVAYTYTDADGCTAEATVQLVVDACASIQELGANMVRLFPNPASDLLYVVADVGTYALRIHDAAGRLVLTQDGLVGNDRENTISLAGLGNGVYTVELITRNDERWTTRLVVAR